MAKSARRFSNDDDSVASSRRKKAKINYNEEDDDDLEEELDDPPVKEDADEEEAEHIASDEDDEDDEEGAPRTRRRHTRQTKGPEIKPRHKADDDDESFAESESELENLDSESDVFSSDYNRLERQREDRHFVLKASDEEADDDEDFDPKKMSGPKKSKRSSRRSNRASRSRTRSHRKVVSDDDEDDDEPLTIHDEVEDLIATQEEYQQPRHFRERKANVNYAIPPPLNEKLDGLPLVQETASPRRRAGASSRAGPVRSLFATAGPFGGGTNTSIFGTNYPAAANQTGADGTLLAAGGDSDSSDDEIVPVMGGDKRSSISAPVGMSMGNDHKKRQNADTDPLGVDMNIDFSSVGGLDNYIDQLKEMVALPLLYPEVYQKFGITPPRGVLFHGPPGTGKTLMARALAASCSSEGRNITFFMRKGADCLSKWVGEAERQLRLLFEEARKQQPSIIFFDEIDGLAPVRSSKQEQIHASIVSTLLALMDGMDNRGQVIVIGATNRPDAVDSALRRPGRFDREFYFPLPDIKAREQILTIHTKKWDPPLSNEFVKKVANMTKGYGGADLRALCTEAALNSIQRRYPQIYQSNDKLEIDPNTIQVAARDFMKALEKIVPSSARSTSSGSAPLPDHLTSLLGEPLNGVTEKLDKLVPRVKKLSALEEAQFVDPTENDPDGGFGKHELLKRLESSRVHRPRLLIAGDAGNGQQYLGAAVLNHLEGFNVQSLDLGQLYGDSTRTAENAIIQSFVEARRHKPSIIFIPNVDIWFDTVSESSKSTLAGLLRSVSSNERILLLGVSETPFSELPTDLKMLFGLSAANYVVLNKPTFEQRKKFFEPLLNALNMKPTEFLDNKKKKKLEKLKKLEVPKQVEKGQDPKSLAKADLRLKNQLKFKLGTVMELFKNRYKRFKKAPIDDYLLVHLFEQFDPSIPQDYVKDGDMILEVHTGRKFYNMDLDVIEERLWHGYYSEPKQFMKDIEMIYKDALVLNDRERLIKASEMISNAQVHIEEISQPEFVEQCRAMRQRELQRIKEYEEKQKELAAAQEVENAATLESFAVNDANTITNGDSSIMITGETRLDVDGDTLLNGTSDHISPHALLENMQSTADDVFNDTSIPEQGVQSSSTGESSDALTQATVVNGERGVQEETQKDQEAEVLSSSSEEEEIPDPPFLIDASRVKTFEHFLVKDTENFTVDQLEQINARLMEIVWDNRHTWDRVKTIDALSDEFTDMQSELYNEDEESGE